MKRVLILQNTIMHYRKAIYNKLSEHYELTILHSGNISITENDNYDEIIAKKISIGPFYFQKGIFKALLDGNYDVVIAMFDIKWLNNIISLFIRSKTKYLLWGHQYSNFRLINGIRNYLMKRSDGVILYNDAEVERMVNSGIKRESIFIAENTIHVENSENGSENKKSSFLYVGRAQKRKKIDELIKAFSLIVDRIPKDITVDIVGTGNENLILEVLAEKLGIKDRVIFHGEINDNEILKPLFFKAFAYVSPDAIGLGAQHSFAYGVPVITTSSGYKGAEYEIITHNRNAILYDKQSELPEVLLSFVEDSSLSKKLGDEAFQFYSNHKTIGRMVQGFIDAIES